MTDGPDVRITLSCVNCRHHKYHAVLDDFGEEREVTCHHPSIGGRVVGETCKTPDWCPLRGAAIAAVFEVAHPSTPSIPTDAELKEIEDRAAKATAGPWFADYQPVGPCAARCYRDQIVTGRNTPIVARPNAAFRGPGKAAREHEIADAIFIAHARTDIERLLKAVQALKQAHNVV